MDYKELLRSGANISLTVNLEDLKELFKEVTTTAGLSAQIKEPEDEL